MRKLFISADMEGCAAVSSQHALSPEKWEWSAARRWMTSEVIAAAEAALGAGYDEVIASDGHGNAQNIDPDALPDNVRLIRSWPRRLLQMQGVESEGVKACAFVGYHGGPSAAGSILAHCYNGMALRSVVLNGEICTEGYLNAAVAGEFGVPVVFVAGDQHTVTDAGRYARDAVTLVTKRSIGWRSQISLPPRQVQHLLKESCSEALARPMPPPFVLQPPYRLVLEMTSQVTAEMLGYLPEVERTGPFTVTRSFERVADVMSFIAFVVLYMPSGGPAL